MAKPPRTTNSGTFFITAITSNRKRIFQVTRNAEMFLEVLQHYRAEEHFKLYGFVVMPQHVHLLLTTEDLPKAMRHIKGGFSRRLDSKFPVWQLGYTDHLVRNRKEFDVRLNYIHQNPVMERMVERAEQYPYSSAYCG